MKQLYNEKNEENPNIEKYWYSNKNMITKFPGTKKV